MVVCSMIISLLLSTWEGGAPGNPFPPISGSIPPGATHKISGERWETTLTVKDEDTWINSGLQLVRVCNPNTGVVPLELPSHEPSAREVLTQSGWDFNSCTKTFVHSKVARILPPGAPEVVYIDKYLFHDNVGPVDAADDEDLVLSQQVWIKGAPPQPPGGGGER
ncbi:MAG: hypothetical protein D6724_05565 [Armatimonadetes bacterium]|nr:MAG: hypothetical protein D6724_05565 [Armatimonadota bacterium]